VTEDHFARFKSALGRVERTRREADVSSRIRAVVETIYQVSREYNELEKRWKKLKAL
jgi:hypothetical protein